MQRYDLLYALLLCLFVLGSIISVLSISFFLDVACKMFWTASATCKLPLFSLIFGPFVVRSCKWLHVFEFVNIVLLCLLSSNRAFIK